MNESRSFSFLGKPEACKKNSTGDLVGALLSDLEGGMNRKTLSKIDIALPEVSSHFNQNHTNENVLISNFSYIFNEDNSFRDFEDRVFKRTILEELSSTVNLTADEDFLLNQLFKFYFYFEEFDY